MATYNLINITNGTALDASRFMFEANRLSGRWLAYAMLLILLVVVFSYLSKKDYSIYTIMPVSFTVTTLVALLFWLIRVNGIGMIDTRILIICIVATSLSAAIRVAVQEPN